MPRFLLHVVLFFALIAVVFSIIVFVAYPLKYKSHIRSAAAAYNVDAVLIASVIRAESNFRPNAVSSKGAIGLMQIMPATAEYIKKFPSFMEGWTRFSADGVVDEAVDLTDPFTNIYMGTFYLRYLIDKFDDLKTALMAYNAGEGNVSKWLGGADRLAISPFPETNAYVQKVLNAKNYYRYRV